MVLSFLEFCQLQEDFNNVLDFLLNPEHRNKTWNQLMDEFIKSGGQEIGVGKYGTVFSHPRWNYVVKMFNDPDYLRFVRFAYRYPHPAFPKFFGTAQRIVPFYKRYSSQATTYIIRMEKLFEVKDKAMLKELVDEYRGGIAYFQAVARGKGEENAEFEREVYPSRQERRMGMGVKNVKVKVYGKTIDLFNKYPQAKNLYEGIYLVSKNIEAHLDIHTGNIMQRANGELVIIDPVWEGTSPYKDAQRAFDMEIDAYGYEPYQEPNLMGGELPKKKRKRKPKKVTYLKGSYGHGTSDDGMSYDEIPF